MKITNKFARFAAILFATVLSAVYLSPASFAVRTPVLSSDSSDSSVHPGEAFTVTVSLDGCDAIKSIRVKPLFDGSVLSLDSMVWTVSGMSISDVNSVMAVGAFSQNTPVYGGILQLNFSVKSRVDIISTVIDFDIILKTKTDGAETVLVSEPCDPLTVMVCPQHIPQTDAGYPPTCTETGLTAGAHCSVCGAVLTPQQVIPATGHKTDDYGICTVCGENCAVEDNVLSIQSCGVTATSDFSANVGVLKTMFAAYDDVFVVITKNGVDLRIDDYTAGTDRNYFTYSGIAAKELGDTFTMTVYGKKDGEVHVGAVRREYSILTYANNQLAKSTSTALFKTVLVDILNYGSAAQTFLGYKTDSLVNAGLTVAQKAFTSQTLPAVTSIKNAAYATIKNPTATWKSASLTVGSKIVMNFIFAADSTDGLSVVVKNSSGNVVGTITTFTSEIKNGTTRYIAEFTGYSPSMVREGAYATVMKNGVAISNTVSYSMESYVSSYMNGAGGANLAELVKSIMKFGLSCKAYLS